MSIGSNLSIGGVFQGMVASCLATAASTILIGGVAKRLYRLTNEQAEIVNGICSAGANLALMHASSFFDLGFKTAATHITIATAAIIAIRKAQERGKALPTHPSPLPQSEFIRLLVFSGAAGHVATVFASAILNLDERLALGAGLVATYGTSYLLLPANKSLGAAKP